MQDESNSMKMEGTSLAETMRYCPNCGFKIPAGTKFCPNCGADLTIFNARVAGETDFGREQSQQPAASEPVREQVRGERSRRQRQSGSTSIKKSLVLTDDSFDHFIDLLATHMVYTLIGVTVLFCVFSFSTIAGWVLAVGCAVAIYVVANRRPVASYTSRFNDDDSGDSDDDIWTAPRPAAGQSVPPYPNPYMTQPDNGPMAQQAQKMSNRSPHWWSHLGTTAGQPRRRGGIIWLVYLIASLVAFTAAYAWPFGAGSVATANVGGSLYDLVRSAVTLAETAATNTGVASPQTNLPYLALILAGIGPVLGLLFGLFRSRGMMRFAGMLGLLGYGALYFAYAPLMSSANNQIQGLLNPGIGFSVGIGAALVMFVTARLLPRD